MKKGLILISIILLSIFFPLNVGSSSVPRDDFFFDEDDVQSLIVIGKTATSAEVISASKLAFMIANNHTKRTEETVYEKFKVSLKNLDVGDSIRINYSNTSVNSIRVSDGLDSLWRDDDLLAFDLVPLGIITEFLDYRETYEEIMINLSDIDCPIDYCVDFNVSDIKYRVKNIHMPFYRQVFAGCDLPLIDIPIIYNEIRFFGRDYPIIYNGVYSSNDHEIRYFIYGRPSYSPNTILRVGDTRNFGWYTVTLLDIHSPTTGTTSKDDKFKVRSGENFSGEYKAYLRVSDFTGWSDEFIMVMDANSSSCCSCVSLCDPKGGYGSFTTVPTRQYQNDPYFIYERGTRIIDGSEETIWAIPVFYIDGIKVFEGANENYLAEFDVYNLRDYGAIEETSCCMPYITKPNNYNLSILNKNESIVAFGVDITGDGNVSEIEEFIPVFSGPDDECGAYINTEILAPLLELLGWDPLPPKIPVFINPGKDGVFGTCDDFLDLDDSNPRFRKCVYDTIEVALCDKIDLSCCDPQTVYGPNEYFKIDILDPSYKENQGVELEVSQEKPKLHLSYESLIKVQPASLIKIDVEVTENDKAAKNLILIGNEDNNMIIRELYDKGVSNVVWSRSFGQWEYIRNVFYENSVLIVGGRDGKVTNKTLEELMKLLFI